MTPVNLLMPSQANSPSRPVPGPVPFACHPIPLLRVLSSPFPAGTTLSSPCIFLWVPRAPPELEAKAGSIWRGVPIIETKGPLEGQQSAVVLQADPRAVTGLLS